MFENPYNHQRGKICVIRFVDGLPTALALADQRWYKEWGGCFSII